MLAVIDYIPINVHYTYKRSYYICTYYMHYTWQDSLQCHFLKRLYGESVKKTIDIFIDHSIRAMRADGVYARMNCAAAQNSTARWSSPENSDKTHIRAPMMFFQTGTLCKESESGIFSIFVWKCQFSDLKRQVIAEIGSIAKIGLPIGPNRV